MWIALVLVCAFVQALWMALAKRELQTLPSLRFTRGNGVRSLELNFQFLGRIPALSKGAARLETNRPGHQNLILKT